MGRSRSLLAITSLAAALALAAGGCKKPLTHVVIRIDTDVPMNALQELTVQCGYNWDGVEDLTTAGGCEIVITRGPGSGPVSALVCLPASFGISVAPGREGQPYTFVVSGASNRYRHIMQITPVPEEVRQLSVRVHSNCVVASPASMAHPCSGSNASCTLSESCIARGQTCGNDGTCVARAIPADQLQVIPRTGPPDAAPTRPVNGMCPLTSFGADSGVDSGTTTDSGTSGDASNDGG
ncbi:MAG: hypothetical protein JNK05_39350 [Myxococcales bacterium]|nr:hypothetical protein [Myxococcales bacterium]